MKLDPNFNQEIEPLINSSKSLAKWFRKNQGMMVYFQMTRPGCLHFEQIPAHYDVKILGRMASECLTWLETELPYSDEDKVKNASMAIAAIYDKEKDLLSDTAKEKYFIDVENLEKNSSSGRHR